MYNEELKSRFISSYTTHKTTARYCRTVFDSFEPVESNIQSDLCTIPADKITPVVDSVISLRSRSRWFQLVILREYAKWCISNNIEGACDALLHISTEGLEKIQTQMCTNPLHLQTYLNVLFSPEDANETDNLYRCFCWLAFAGMRQQDIFQLKTSDVDFENMIIRYGSFEYPIYREALPSFKNCVNLTEFTYRHPLYDTKYRTRVDGDELLRGYREMPTPRSMRTLLSRYSKRALDAGKTKQKMNYNGIQLSGIFFRMYEQEMAGLPVDFMPDALRFVSYRDYEMDLNNKSDRAQVKQIARDYLLDYNRWKVAFNL